MEEPGLTDGSGDDDSSVFLYPRWREAIKLFHAAGYKAGDIIEHSWLYQAFDIEEPKPTTLSRDADRLRLAFLGQFTPFRQCLLREYKMDLESAPGTGYKILLPSEQTNAAYTDGLSEITKGMRKMISRIVHTDINALSEVERRENAESLAKAATLQSLIAGTRKRLGDTVGL